MTAGVISHRGAPRKRAPSRGWTARRLMAAALTLAALAAITLVAPYLRPVATKVADQPPRPNATDITTPALTPTSEEAEHSAILGAARTVRPRRSNNSGVPLDASATMPGEDFEVLSASELAAISQASE